MYGYAYNWLVLGSRLNESVPMLNDSAYSITTDLVLAITSGSGYDLYDVFNHCKYRGGKLNVTRLGSWSEEAGLVVTLTQPIIQRRANMNGMTLKISGVVRYFYASKEKSIFSSNLYIYLPHFYLTYVCPVADTIQAQRYAAGGLYARH